MELLSYRQVGAVLADASESTIRRYVKAGVLPPPVRLAERKDGLPSRVGFVKDEVLAAVDRLVAEKRGGAPEAA